MTSFCPYRRIFSSGEYADEQQRVRELLEREGETAGKVHLLEFLEEWNRKQDE